MENIPIEITTREEDNCENNTDPIVPYTDILRQKMDIILRYKQTKRIKSKAVSTNFHYFIKK